MWIALDCDGVILDSNEMKCGAFAAITDGYEEAARAAFLAYQRTAFGTSRYRLVDRFFTDFLKREPAKGERDLLLARYAERCSHDYPRQPFTEGAREAIEALHARGDTLAVVSGSDQEELRDTLATIGIAALFAGGIFGSPAAKADLLGAVRDRAGGEGIVFVGDAEADWRAAEANGVRFVGMTTWSADPGALTRLQSEHGFEMIAKLPELVEKMQ